MKDLIDHIAARDRAWKALVGREERAAIRAQYEAAGWKVCSHPSCPPFDCQGGQ